jgi:hypothetical protein
VCLQPGFGYPEMNDVRLTYLTNRFRVFFLACAEFFAMDRGETWGLGHYLCVTCHQPTKHQIADTLDFPDRIRFEKR